MTNLSREILMVEWRNDKMRVLPSPPDFFRSPVFFEARRRSRFAGVLRVRTQLCEPLRWCGRSRVRPFDHVDHSISSAHHQRLLLLFALSTYYSYVEAKTR